MPRPIIAVAGLSAILSLSLLAPRQDSTPPALPATAAARVALLQSEPGRAGDLVYDGRVSALDTTRHAVLFRYQRRVAADGAWLRSNHITRDPAGAVVVIQSARHDAHYALESAELIHAQTGAVSQVQVQGDELWFSSTRGGKTRRSHERVSDPVIAGPSTFGYILAHWDELASGRRLPVRFVVLERSESIGFVLERAGDDAGITRIRMTPSHPLVRLVAAPTTFEFEARTRHITAYSGRVPPLQRVRGKLSELDARVEYTFAAADFR